MSDNKAFDAGGEGGREADTEALKEEFWIDYKEAKQSIQPSREGIGKSISKTGDSESSAEKTDSTQSSIKGITNIRKTSGSEINTGETTHNIQTDSGGIDSSINRSDRENKTLQTESSLGNSSYTEPIDSSLSRTNGFKNSEHNTRRRHDMDANKDGINSSKNNIESLGERRFGSEKSTNASKGGIKYIYREGVAVNEGQVTKDVEASSGGGVFDDNVDKDDLLYGVEDVPPWYKSLLLAIQNFLVLIGGTIATPLAVAGYMCMDENDPGRGTIIATLIFVSGILTLMQTTFGVRLPIIQGSNFAYLAPTITLLTTSFPPCSSLDLDNMTPEEKTEVWQERMRGIQGAVIVSSFLQVFLGFTGIEGMLMVLVTPLTVVATITMLGLSLYRVGSDQASTHWGISGMHLVLLVLVSQYMKNIKVPLPLYSRTKGWYTHRFPIFSYFPLLLVTLLSWSICGILTATDVLPQGSPARTDYSGTLLANSPWFRLPYPGQWGMPTVAIGAVMGMVASVIASIIESIGDYNACAEMCHVMTPPSHAVTRGSGIEGLGSVLAGIFGTTSGTASYTTNIMIIGITKVASRRVIQYTGVIMLFVGLFSKFCAVFATIPEPVLGANLIFMFALVTGLGLSQLRIIDLSSTRNLFVLGFSIFMAMCIPEWLTRNPEAINTGSTIFDNSVTALLQTSMFVGGSLALVLDNTIPGTEKERGLTQWLYYQQSRNLTPVSYLDPTAKVYDLPFGMDAIRRWKWTRRVPFLPTFEGFRRRKPRVSSDTLQSPPPQPDTITPSTTDLTTTTPISSHTRL